VGPCRQYIYIYMGPQSFPGLWFRAYNTWPHFSQNVSTF
jgi:hypothetical protein